MYKRCNSTVLHLKTFWMLALCKTKKKAIKGVTYSVMNSFILKILLCVVIIFGLSAFDKTKSSNTMEQEVFRIFPQVHFTKCFALDSVVVLCQISFIILSTMWKFTSSSFFDKQLTSRELLATLQSSSAKQNPCN